jgi:hypothetical protein
VTRRSRLRLDGPVSVPVVLPRVIVRPDDARTVMVTLDGDPVSDEPIPRVQLGEAISQIIEQVGAAVRVEINEPDGTVHADILTPPAHQPGEPAPPPDRPHQRERPSPADVWSGSLKPGEAVHVGAIATIAAADADGNLHVDLDPLLGRNGDGRVLAVGAPSGTTRSQEPA